MKANTLLFLLILALAFLLPKFVHGAEADAAHFVAISDFDLVKLLAPPPGNYSPETAAELRKIVQLQKDLTPDQQAAIRDEDPLTPTAFCGGLFSKWTGAEASRMAELLCLVAEDAGRISDGSKMIWDRPRPSRLEKKIQKLVDMPPGSSYPGSNSTVAYTWAALLSAALPDRKDEIMARADQIAQDRVIAGVQYPSDIAAGKILGTAIGIKLMKKPDFQEKLHAALADLEAVPAAYVSAENNPGFAP